MHLQGMLSLRVALASVAVVVSGRVATAPAAEGAARTSDTAHPRLRVLPEPAFAAATRAANGVACQDTVAPRLPLFGQASLPTNAWVSDNRLSLEWAPATDDSCGLDGYAELWSEVATACPASVKDREAAPSTLTVALPDGIWYYALKPVDLAGNWTLDCARAGPFQIDTTPPTAPNLVTSSSHPVGGWSRLDRIALAWQAPPDTASGIAGYAVTVTAGGGTLPPEQLDIGPVASHLTAAQPEGGGLYVNLRAVDVAGNWGTSFASLGPIGIDLTPPAAPHGFTSSSHAVGVNSSLRVVVVEWIPSSDALSGLRGYSVQWSQVATDDPTGVLNTLPPGATSPELGNGSWWFHVQALDMAGGRSSTVHFGPFLIGVMPPDPPLSGSSSHSLVGCSVDCTIDVGWTLSSGAVGYSLEWSTAAETVPDTLIDTIVRVSSSPCLATGNWYFHLRAVNGIQAWSSASHAGPFAIDTTPPVGAAALASGTHQPDRWSPHTVIALSISGASDVGCGLGGYSVLFDRFPSTLPDPSIDVREDEVWSPVLPDGGPWHAHVRTIDLARNTAAEVLHMGPMWIDSAPPHVTLISPNGGEVLQGGTTIPIVVDAEDVLSGIHASRIEASLDAGSTWSLEIARDVPLGTVVQWQVPDLDVAAARVRVLTTDRAGNVSSDQSDDVFAIEASPPPPPPPPPATYALDPNVPNPFNPTTSIGVDLPAAGTLRLQVLDLRGRALATLWDGWRDAGRHRFGWDGRDGEGRPLPSGVYVYRLEAGSYSASRKLAILR